MRSKELVAASTVPLVLSILAQGEEYGYALIQRGRELSGGKSGCLHFAQRTSLN
jgi:hypothetical protein